MKNHFIFNIIIFLIILISSLLFVNINIINAKVFRNAYVSFELPSNWKCSLEHTEWVCRSQIKKDSREAIIILTAKEKGPTDSFEAYMIHLKTPRILHNQGKQLKSKIIHTKQVKINDQVWVDGWHLQSEIPNYYTRYLATIKGKLAILVTFSAHKLHYTKYSKDFFRAIKSLKVIASNGLLNNPSISNEVRSGNETLGGSIGGAIPGDMFGTDNIPEEDDFNQNNRRNLIIGIAIILMAIGAYLLIRKK